MNSEMEAKLELLRQIDRVNQTPVVLGTPEYSKKTEKLLEELWRLYESLSTG
jgi:hypothetical protein